MVSVVSVVAVVAGLLLLVACTTPGPQPGSLSGEQVVKPEESAHKGSADGSAGPAAGAQDSSHLERHHVDIHGLYMTGWTAGSDQFYHLVDYMVASGLNAAVIDVQDDDGLTSWEVAVPLAREIGANEQKITDIASRIAYLKQKGIYTVGRIVVYADPLLGSKRPEMAIQGGDFVDTRGIRWPDPYNQEVWAYKVAIAKEAVAAGFDEIQFDYIRFPEHRIPGYNAGVPVTKRVGAVESFLRYAVDQLHPLGAFVSADLFGLTTTVDPGDDMEIGQDYGRIAQIVDYVWPMVYPSHYAPGTYGLTDPNQAPGRVVYESLVGAQKRTDGLPRQKHRPWIQDFNYGKAYTAADIEDQIQGLAEAGIYQWVLWDPSNRYTRGVDYGVGGGTNGPPGRWQTAWADAQNRSIGPSFPMISEN
jgi:hypothetical protein